MGISLETLALAKQYADAVAAAGSEEAIQKAIEQAVQQSKTYTDIAIGELTQFNITIVNSLPTTDIKTHTIYFLPISPLEEDNGYYEYMYIEGQWELIGSTRIDLSNYYTKKEVEQYILDNKYVLPIASHDTLGGVKIDNYTILINKEGVISVNDVVTNNTAQNVVNKNFTNISDSEINSLFT